MSLLKPNILGYPFIVDRYLEKMFEIECLYDQNHTAVMGLSHNR